MLYIARILLHTWLTPLAAWYTAVSGRMVVGFWVGRDEELTSDCGAGRELPERAA